MSTPKRHTRKYRRLPRLLAAALVVAHVAVGCGYDSFGDYTPTPTASLTPNAPISIATSAASEPHHTLPEGVVVEGTVVANDIGENFYRTIVLQDPTASIELNVGLYDLHNRFPLGARLRVDIGGLKCLSYNGVVQVGRAIYEWDDEQVEPLGLRSEVDRRTQVVAVEPEPEPLRVSHEELSSDLCGRLVSIEGARYVGEQTQWGTTDYGSYASRLFLTRSGDSIAVSTSRYATFANDFIPTAEGTLRGILYRDRLFGADLYVIKMRTASDFSTAP